jgi:pilus assembly protein Flp/PilA
MKALITKFVKDESGATAIEYAIIAGLVSIAAIATITLAAPQLQAIWVAIVAALTNAATTAAG